MSGIAAAIVIAVFRGEIEDITKTTTTTTTTTTTITITNTIDEVLQDRVQRTVNLVEMDTTITTTTIGPSRRLDLVHT